MLCLSYLYIVGCCGLVGPKCSIHSGYVILGWYARSSERVPVSLPEVWDMTNLVSEQVCVLGSLQVVSSRVLLMDILCTTFIIKRLSGIRGWSHFFHTLDRVIELSNKNSIPMDLDYVTKMPTTRNTTTSLRKSMMVGKGTNRVPPASIG